MGNNILFHICCGPCATASIKKLQDEGYKVTGYYYNPNIHPNSEYKKRLEEAMKLSKTLSSELIINEYQPKEYFKIIKGLERDKKERCLKCWELRLKRTAQKAKELNINIIGTTLRISPYQDQERLLNLGQVIAKDNNLSFYDDDLEFCFKESVEISKDQGMYRQKYCGCVFSKEYI